MTVKHFITQHQGIPLNMMTPGGFVLLTPESAQALLTGKATQGHPGDPEMAVEIDAEELLTQNVHSVNFSDGAWHLLTDYSQEECHEIKEIDRAEILERLREKISKNMEDFQKEWLTLPPSEIVGRAEEINATRIAYNELHSGWAYFEDKLEYLLRFENPLEVVRDMWISEQCQPDVSNEMNHALWTIMDKQEAEQEYEMDESYAPPDMEQGMEFC